MPTSTDPDAPPRPTSAPSATRPLPPISDLDGLYLWLGPTAAVSYERTWDSTFGGDATVLRIREGEAIGAIGATVGAARWTEHGGGRLWLDGLVGSEQLVGRMVGVSAGPCLELADLRHPRFGASVGLWAFFGVTPYARIGAVDGLGAFGEVGLHVALPVLRRRP